ncbi:glycosyltransferase [Arthrobacter sp. ISL-5]|uniref:glycosyltransferase n=1 Tax=Arthrobacter sp. ISL-5 TaxID=2819111 RepID=UPI001BE648FF|nr:glycosyltransferase [Arthrobacter sp. ISL-5]MBT2552819.1 glycosyltransferase [Arthrobacter sp. ISL-5]
MSGVLVHEWLGQTGGAEKVLDVLAEIYPDTDIYCLWDDTGRRERRHLRESLLAKTPLRRSKALALPFMPFVWRQLTSDKDYDWMLVSSHLFAHHARFRGRNAGVPKFVYAHTPARYIWEPELDERGNNVLIRTASQVFQALDRTRSKEPLSIAANSMFVAARIERCWNREAQVIYPPVDVSLIRSTEDWTSALGDGEEIQLAALPSEFVLGASRFVGYKKLDIAIRAAELVGLPAVIAGSGPDEAQLRERAASSSVPVTFIVHPSDHMLFALYQKCSVYVFPPIEDFGIMPVEAAAAGAPVVANRVGGTSETVWDGESGYLAAMDDDQDLRSAVERAMSLDRSKIAPTSSRFSTEKFRQNILDWIPSGPFATHDHMERG